MNETAETAAQVSDQLYQAVLNRMNITLGPDRKTNVTQKRHKKPWTTCEILPEAQGFRLKRRTSTAAYNSGLVLCE